MQLKKTLTVSMMSLALLGVGIFSTQLTNHSAHASAPVVKILYTNGKYNYFYPYDNNNIKKYFWFHQYKIGRLINRKTPLAKRYRVNTPMMVYTDKDFYETKNHNIYDPGKPQEIPIHHHKYYLVNSIATKHGIEALKSLDGKHSNMNPDYISGYMNPKDFSTHKVHVHKHHAIKRHKSNLKHRKHLRKHAKKSRRMRKHSKRHYRKHHYSHHRK